MEVNHCTIKQSGEQSEARDGFVRSKVEAFSTSNNLSTLHPLYSQRTETKACVAQLILS